MSNLHQGHRERMRKRYLASGFEDFEDHEILEMILYYCYRQCDTNPVAHMLLDTFGSLSAIFDAPVDTIMSAGVSENVAVFLKMIPDIARVYMDDKHNNRSKIITRDIVGDYFVNKFIGRQEETLILLLLDAKGTELFCGVVATGNATNTDVPFRKIVDLSLRYNAVNVYLAHNHPSGVALPSKADVFVTNELHSVLAAVGVRLLDHIIIADGEYQSLREGLVCDCFEQSY